MTLARHTITTRLHQAVAPLALAILAGCASTQIGVEWSDPQFAGTRLAGQKVYVSCQSVDLTLQLVCADRLAAQLKTLGAVPVLAPAPAGAGNEAVPTVGRELAAARAAGAAALLNVSVAPDASVVAPAPSFSIGIGGFGGGSYSGGGVGVGMGVPVGSASVNTGHAANAALTDVASGKPMWTARASSPPSSNVNQQLAELASTLLGSARKAGFF